MRGERRGIGVSIFMCFFRRLCLTTFFSVDIRVRGEILTFSVFQSALAPRHASETRTERSRCSAYTLGVSAR